MYMKIPLTGYTCSVHNFILSNEPIINKNGIKLRKCGEMIKRISGGLGSRNRKMNSKSLPDIRQKIKIESIQNMFHTGYLCLVVVSIGVALVCGLKEVENNVSCKL